MTSSANVHRCDYLHLHSLPPVFTSERAELVHVNQQLTSLDAHISQLSALRENLHRRSCELHNSLSPIRVLPVEVLSYIFQQLINTYYNEGPHFFYYRRGLAQALVLSSVSSYFRRIAFDTPMLWTNIPIQIPNNQAMDTVSSLLQHCVALAPCVNVAVFETLGEHQPSEEHVSSAVNIILAPHVTRKVKDFELLASRYASIWVEKLNGSSFPVLNALNITTRDNNPILDFGSLKTLTRLRIYDRSLEQPVVLPPSVQHLEAGSVTPQALISLVHQCPDLVTCEVDINPELEALFAGPVTLYHLERLVFRVMGNLETRMLAESMIMPLLETLQIDQDSSDTFIGVLPLCRNVSATLTTLVFNMTCPDALDPDSLYQVCMLPLPELVEFELWSNQFEPFVSAIQALASVDGECSKSETHHLPALEAIVLRCYGSEIKPHSLPALLKKWRIGDALNFYLELASDEFESRHWPPKLRRQLKSIVGDRRVEISWGNCVEYYSCF